MPNPKAGTREAGDLKNAYGGLFVALGVIAISYSALFFVSSAISHADTMRFQYEGHGAPGEIDAVQGSLLLRNFSVAYHYADETGETHHATEVYRFPDAVDLRPGQPIDVVYLLRQPDHSRIAANQSQDMIQQKDVPWLTMCAVALGGIFSIGIGVGRLQRNWPS